MERRTFLKTTGAGALLGGVELRARARRAAAPAAAPARIPNEYSLLLPGERAALDATPAGEGDGWRKLAALADGTQVYEKHATHRGVVVYVKDGRATARIPTGVGDLSRIRPRPLNQRGFVLRRPKRYTPGPDRAAEAVLASGEDPCYENVAGLGAEFLGWTLVANEQCGPEGSLWLEPDGRSRQFGTDPQALFAPDLTGRRFDPRRLLPSEYLYEYVPGYSKRTVLGGFLPAADVGVWNPNFELGYEAMVLLPDGAGAQPMARLRIQTPAGKGTLIPAGDTNAGQAAPPSGWTDRYWQCDAAGFFTELLALWRKWSAFFEDALPIAVPDPWLLDAARAGIALARCSYRGLEPTYQIGEGAYTKIPERSHALFPVAHYEFVWAQQLWGLADAAEPYFEHYLERYILPSGEFVYNTQDQVEAPLNTGIFLTLSARHFDHTGDRAALERRLPVLRRMIGFVLERYEYSKRTFPPGDGRHGLIWGSPEADMGDPKDNRPGSHPYYFQNAAWTWRGLREHARCLRAAGLADEASAAEATAAEMRALVERSLERTLAARAPAMAAAGIAPFSPGDTRRAPSELSSYENHRYMMDWWTADWGGAQGAAMDRGHFRHRELAGQQMLGMNLDGDYPRTSNFMEHGTLAGRIRQDDYRPFLMALYGNACHAMDAGSRYAPEDALLPGNFPGEGSPYAWSAVINSTLQPALGLRWLLCYEEWDPPRGEARCHLQKAAPRHWFLPGERIAVARCPTRWGRIGWETTAVSDRHWRVQLDVPAGWNAEVVVHIHPPQGAPLRRSLRPAPGSHTLEIEI